MTINSKLLTKVALTTIISLIGYKIYTNFDKNIRRILITGANKGIGYGIAKYILQNTSNYHIILSGRNPFKINQALKSLINISPSFKHRITTLIMDVSKKKQIQKAATQLQNKFGSDLHLYCIVNNAGIFPEINTTDKTLDIATKTIQTNFWGLAYVTQYFSPLLNDKGSRIVNISSGGGPLNVSKMSTEKQSIILNKNIDIKQLSEFINEFLDAYAKLDDKRGFRLHAYGFSKACVNTYTCFIAPNMFENKNILVNCCTPGLVNTDLIKQWNTKSPKKSIDEGIIVPIKLILGDIQQKTGTFFGGVHCEEYCLDQYVSKKERNRNT
eukprot:457314_1